MYSDKDLYARLRKPAVALLYGRIKRFLQSTYKHRLAFGEHQLQERLGEVDIIAYFDFSALIKKYSTTFTVEIPGETYTDEYGDRRMGEPTQQTFVGAIISNRESKIFRSEGTITEQDRALYMLEALPEALHGAKVIHGDKVYTLSSALINAEFTGIWAYRLKYISVFGGVGNA